MFFYSIDFSSDCRNYVTMCQLQIICTINVMKDSGTVKASYNSVKLE